MKTMTLSLLGLCLSIATLQAQWETLSGLTTDKIHTLAMDPDSPGTVYAGTECGMFVSQDNGESWTLIMSSGLKYNDVGSIAVKNGMLLAGSWEPGANLLRGIRESLPRGDVSLSVDGGRNWTAAKNGLTARGVTALAQCSSGFLAASSDGNGIFRTTDTGATWTLVSPKKSFTNITTAPCGLFAVSYRDMYRSQDDGLTWQRIDLGMKCSSIDGIAYTGNTIYVSASRITDWHAPGIIEGKKAVSVLFRSVDAGEHWSTLPIPASPLIGGVYASDDTVIAAFHSLDPAQGSTAITIRKSGLDLTTPLLRDGDPPQHATQSDSPSLSDEGPAGIHVSTNGGLTWTTVNDGLPVTSMGGVTARNGYVFAISDMGGLFRRPMAQLVSAAHAGGNKNGK